MVVRKRSTTSSKQAGDYVQTLNPLGYIHNREITNLPGQYLVQGSQNCFIRNGEKVVSRNGYSLLGAAKTGNLGVHSSHDWNNISSGSKRSLRGFYNTLQVYYKGVWEGIYSLPTSRHLSFTTWWNSDELIDVLLWVDGGVTISEWSGGITTVASVTASTITKQGYVTGTNFAFHNNGTGQPGTIIRATGGFINAGFVAGDSIVISGSASNNGAFIIDSVTDTTLVINAAYTITTEVVGATVVLKWPNGTWAEQRFLTTNDGDDTDRSVMIDGQKYKYTGGEGTGTLTGVTPDPTVATSTITPGTLVVQAVRIYSPSAIAAFQADLIGLKDNQIFIGSTVSRFVYMSKDTDFSDYTFTTPLRIPGEGNKFQLDSCPTAFKSGLDTNTDSSVYYIFAGTSDLYRIQFKQQVSQDASGVSRVYETTPIKKLPTGAGSAAISQDVCVDIKNGTAYISHEKAVDALSHVTNVVINSPEATPISDPIRDDMLAYDLTGAQGVYIDRMLWYTIPAEGKIISYDYSNKNFYWNPPQLITVSRLATIEIDGVLTLCGHSANSDETYVLFKRGVRNDNGAKFRFIATFGYENYGARFMKKNFDEYASELYMTQSTVVNDEVFFDYKGASGTISLPILGTDTATNFTPSGSASEGSNPEGYASEGSTTDEMPDIVKKRIIHDTSPIDFYERQRSYWSDSEDLYVEILAYGENVQMSENLPTEIHQ